MCTVIMGGDSLKQKLDSISDTVTDNVRETGTTVDCDDDDDECCMLCLVSGLFTMNSHCLCGCDNQGCYQLSTKITEIRCNFLFVLYQL